MNSTLLWAAKCALRVRDFITSIGNLSVLGQALRLAQRSRSRMVDMQRLLEEVKMKFITLVIRAC